MKQSTKLTWLVLSLVVLLPAMALGQSFQAAVSGIVADPMRSGCGLSTTAITSIRLSKSAAKFAVSRNCRLKFRIKGMDTRSNRATVWVETAECTPGDSEYLPIALAVRQPDNSRVRSSRNVDVF